MDDSIKDGVGSRGVAQEHVVPVHHGQLRHDDGGFAPVSVLDDLKEVEQLLPVEGLHPEIVDDEQVLPISLQMIFNCSIFGGNQQRKFHRNYLIQKKRYFCVVFFQDSNHEIIFKEYESSQ